MLRLENEARPRLAIPSRCTRAPWPDWHSGIGSRKNGRLPVHALPPIVVPLLLFATLWVPGHPLLPRLAPRFTSQCQLPGRIALDCMLTFVLLAPAMVLAFALETTVGWLCLYYVAISAVALLAMARRRHRGVPGGHLRHLAPAGLLIVGTDLALAVYAGPHWTGDAPLHIARIRALVEEHFSVVDPAIAAPAVLTGYHINVHHGLFALVSALSGSDAIWVWAAGLLLAKLLVASAVYFASRSIFRTDRAAWAAVAFAVGALWPISFLHYPNRLAAYWLVTLQLGLVVEIVRGGLPTRETALLLALTGLVTGLVHPLVAAIAAAVFAPVLACWGLHRVRWRHGGAASFWPTAAVLTGLPFTLASYLLQAVQHDPPRAFLRLMDTLAGGWRVISPTAGLSAWGLVNAYVGVPLLLVGCGLLLASGVRRAVAAALLAIVVLVANVLYDPLLATPLLAVVPSWMVYRFGSVLVVLTFAVVPGATAMLLLRLTTRLRRVASVALVQATILIMALCGHAWAKVCFHGMGWHSYTARQPYVLDLTSPESLQLQQVLAREVPADAVILTMPGVAKLVLALHSTNVVAIPLGNTTGTVLDANERLSAVKQLLDRHRPPDPAVEDELLERYGIDYVLLLSRTPRPPWLQRLELTETEVRPWKLYRIRTPASAR
jgi:hypothetical protein